MYVLTTAVNQAYMYLYVVDLVSTSIIWSHTRTYADEIIGKIIQGNQNHPPSRVEQQKWKQS